MKIETMRAAALAAALLLSCGDVEASDTGKEAFCDGMDDLAAEVKAGGPIQPAEVRQRLLELVEMGRASVDDDFVDLLDEFEAGVRARDDGPEAIETTNAVADACFDYAEIDADL